MKKVLLINPPYFAQIFTGSAVRAMVSPGIMPLGLACIAAPLKAENIAVEILDLNLTSNPERVLRDKMRSFKPGIVGITFTTPLFNAASSLAKCVKEMAGDTITVCGGPHVSIFPEETIKNSGFDIGVLREGDLTFKQIVIGDDLSKIDGVVYKDKGAVVVNQPKVFIDDLDQLPYASVDLFDIPKYRYPKVTSRTNPVASLETSRGCFSRCTYCNKSVFGYKFRPKSLKRVVDEIEFILKCGYKEIHIIDDGFTTDMDRAAGICKEIKKRKLNFPWYVRGGVRVDRVSKGLLKDMKEAGCYRIPLGIESGDQGILDGVGKGIKLWQIENAVKWANEAGMIVDGYFMLGLPSETRELMEKSIKFACKLELDYAKFAITVPLPGTPLFNDLKNKGCILTEDWAKYNFAASPRNLYKHENIDWDVLDRYYKESHRRFYFRGRYILKRVIAGIRRGELLAYMKAFLDFMRSIF